MYSFKYSKLLVTKLLLCKTNQKDALFLATGTSIIDGIRESKKKTNFVLARRICIEADRINRKYRMRISRRKYVNMMLESLMKVAAKVRALQSQCAAQV